MARKLALIFAIIQSIQIAIALPTPLPIAMEKSMSSLTPQANNHHPELHDKRFFFPETLPDQDELEAVLKETAMREAGFIPSKPRPEPEPEREPECNRKWGSKLQKSLPDAGAKIGTVAASARPVKLCNPSSTLSTVAEAFRTYTPDEYPIFWSPLGFFVVGAAIVCCCTVLRGIRAKK